MLILYSRNYSYNKPHNRLKSCTIIIRKYAINTISNLQKEIDSNDYIIVMSGKIRN